MNQNMFVGKICCRGWNFSRSNFNNLKAIAHRMPKRHLTMIGIWEDWCYLLACCLVASCSFQRALKCSVLLLFALIFALALKYSCTPPALQEATRNKKLLGAPGIATRSKFFKNPSVMAQLLNLVVGQHPHSLLKAHARRVHLTLNVGGKPLRAMASTKRLGSRH